jgi:hypothetical protein
MRIPGTCLKSLLLFSVALFLGGCSTSGKVSKETRKPEPQSELMSIFPTEEQIPSLQFPEPPKSVPRDKFALYLGTRAPRYESYNVQEILYASYYNPAKTSEGPAVDVEVIRFASSDDAFGAFSVERPVLQESAQVRKQGYITESKAGFWSGELYLRMLVPKDTPENSRCLKMVAEAASRRLRPGPAVPSGFSRLLSENRIANSERFIRLRVLGYDFLTDGYLADYRLDGNTATAFVCPCVDEAAARERFRAFFEAIVDQNARVVPVAGLGDRAFMARGTRHGNVVIFQRDRFLAGLLAVPTTLGDFLPRFDAHLTAASSESSQPTGELRK